MHNWGEVQKQVGNSKICQKDLHIINVENCEFSCFENNEMLTVNSYKIQQK